jgi:anti-sigma B factor antagonist
VPRTQLSIREADPGVFIVTGEIDAHSAPALEARLGEAKCGSVVLDLSGVEFIDSSGLRVLVTQQQRRTAQGHHFAVADPSVCVQRLFDMVGLTEFFIEPTHSEPEE